MNTAVLERPPLVTISGTVLEIVPAPASNRSGKIKLDDGKILSAFPDKLSAIVEGGSYDFGCTETNKSGVIYRDVKTVRTAAAPASGYAGQHTRHAAPAQPRPAAVRQSAPVEPAHREPPRQERPQSNGNGNYYRPTSPQDARRMFLCSQLNAMITSHQVTMTSQGIAEAIAMLAEAYDATIGAEDQA